MEQFAWIESFRVKKLDEQLESGIAVFYKTTNDITNKMVAYKYHTNQDKSGNKQKIEYMLSSYYNPIMIDTGKTDKSGNSIIKPSNVKHYNTHMGGADRVDQQLHRIQVLRKTYKWYKKLAFRLIMQCSLNARKVYAHDTGSDITFLCFLLSNMKLIFC